MNPGIQAELPELPAADSALCLNWSARRLGGQAGCHTIPRRRREDRIRAKANGQYNLEEQKRQAAEAAKDDDMEDDLL